MLKGLTRFGSLAAILAAVFLPSIAGAFTISGIVTDPVSAPVQNVDVFLYDDQGNPIGIPQTRTAVDGSYSILSIPAGTYGLEFVPPSNTGLLTKFTGGVVVSGNTTVNAQLELGHVISGFVRDSLGVGILDIDLNVYVQSTGSLVTTPGDNTDATGHYQILVGTGTYRIRWRSTLPGQRWAPVQIENLNITHDTTINITMVSGYFVSGTVRNQALVPQPNVDLDIIDGAGTTLITPGDNTDVSGFYQILIPGGTFTVQVEPPVATKLVAKESLGVVINADKTVDFTLQSGFAVSGMVKSTGGVGISGADINVNFPNHGAKLFTPADRTDGGGLYNVIVPLGTFDFAYRPPVASHKVSLQKLNIPVTKDTVIDVTVTDGIILSSTVTGPGGPVANVDLDALKMPGAVDTYLFDDFTTVAGTMSVVLTPGTYMLEFQPPFALKLVGKRFSSMSLLTDTNLPVSLVAGHVVSGMVRDFNDAPQSGANVDAIDASTGDTVYTPGDTSSAAGFYDIIIPPDTYNLLFRPRSGSGITDSALVLNVPISKDTTINAKFAGSGSSCQCGDANGDYAVDISDAVFLIQYIFAGGPEPGPCGYPNGDGDSNGDCAVDISDAVYLIQYIFAGGPAPLCGTGCK